MALLLLLACLQTPEPRERAAVDAVAEEMLKLARLCVSNRAYIDAFSELKRGAAATGSKKLEDEIKKVPSKEDATKPDWGKKLDAERAKTNQKCADLLADAALALRKEGNTAAWERLLWRIQQHFPSDKTSERLGVAWFEPYIAWLDRADVKRMEAGDELVDGKWLTAAEVAEQDRQHASWDDPWKVSDGVHEVRTTVKLRSAKQLLANVTAFRTHFLREFEGLWDLKAPEGLLPVYFTATYQEMLDRTKEAGLDLEKRDDGRKAAAWYLHGPGTLNPCFVTLEPMSIDGSRKKVELKFILTTLRHELSHQMAFEYSKHDAAEGRVTHQVWSLEGFAEYMGAWTLDRGRWRLAAPRTVYEGADAYEGSLAWAVINRTALVHISKFTNWTRQDLRKIETYNAGAGLAWFLMQGAGGKYRAPFCKLLERVHQVHDTEETWAECFPDVDRDKLHKEWVDWLGKQRVE